MKYLLKILMNILWSCLQAGTFGIESVIRERGGRWDWDVGWIKLVRKM